jgi:hypothetical protein
MISTGSIVTETTPALADATASFDDRYAALRPRLLAICSGLVGIDAAEDVVQDGYLRGRGRHGQLRDPASLADSPRWLPKAPWATGASVSTDGSMTDTCSR